MDPQRKERFWLDDPVTFATNVDYATKFIPDKNMNLAEQLNATMRFALYFSIIVYIVRQDYRVFFFVIFVAFVTIVINNVDRNSKNKRTQILEKLDLTHDRQHGLCIKPTKNNPFMNVIPTDYQDFPSRPKACNISKRPIKKIVNQYMDGGLYRDVDDVFHRKASGRQFYTMPVTTIPSEQNQFAEWLYATGPTCKEKTFECMTR